MNPITQHQPSRQDDAVLRNTLLKLTAAQKIICTVVVAAVALIWYDLLNRLIAFGHGMDYTGLHALGVPCVGVEHDDGAVGIAVARALRIPVVFADARTPGVLADVHVERARAVMAVTNDDLANLQCGLAAREHSPGLRVVLRIFDPHLAERLDMTRAQMVSADDDRGDWFDTGDLAYIDADGYLRISGRTKDVIIRGGENIPVAYVENMLYEHPGIGNVAVVAVPDPRLQERACACVVLAPGVEELTVEQMQAFLAEKGVAKQYWPEKLLVLDDFPKTPSGKIQKFQLREQVAQS